MKSILLSAIAGSLLLAAPVYAQEDAVKVGVDAYERGDYKTAVEKWRPAAERGNADAQFNLGQAFKLGRGVAIDLRQAEEWYRRAALQGHEQAEANYGLALFENGKRGEAIQWLERGVTRGDARTQYILGIMLFNGDVIRKDWVRAYALMTRSSQSGLDAASKALAQMDQYIPLADRQDGAALARKYEEEFRRGGTRLPPVTVADNAPIPSPSSIGAAPSPVPPTQRPSAPAPRPAPRAAQPAPPAPVAKTPAPAVRDGGWRVQLGAFGDPSNARKLWSQVASRFPGRQVYYVKAGSLTKVLVGPFGSRSEAAGACGRFSPCVPVTR